MIPFMDEDFLLQSATARHLYHDFAAEMPIYDFHCHLNPQEIAEDRRFANLGQIWLEGDHYKWRALRAAGVDESLITGNATSDYDKYLAWAATVPKTLGNPLYHWTHLELRRPFGISGTLFGPQSAKAIWDRCAQLLATPEFSARGIMRQMKVRMVGTTDDPIDSLQYHRQIADDNGIDIDVAPSWRPDNVFKIELDGFAGYLSRLEAAADVAIDSFDALRRALLRRLDHFSAHGCRASDHGIETLRYAPVPDDRVLDAILAKRRRSEALNELEISQFSTAVLVWLGTEYARRGWVMQLHIGAIRNNSTRMFRLLGPDSGFDSIGDNNIAWPLARLLDSMDSSDQLPKTILYCLNPRDNEVLATMAGNFQGAGIAGKIQFGSGWWFNDQRDGMLRQLEQLSQIGLLSQFVGMLTDSRSFLSYTRHEYFRRILCNLLGQWVQDGIAPDDRQWLGQMVQDICYRNAERYFALPAA
ncbi:MULTISPECIES: glucuronate isomerase [Brenneria]|uniref:Uronate isomerase n=1 Tax=Brenneria nigrifluens DSM 30175 = ATCC 13028 TaxID=1121120 RepID=A0A2U1UU42_9GAMM|nr:MULTISPECIES: glucuronate isomerase [Brenneria]EHD21865.1 Uronate isomerase [Brenneria sp. EniD312]PWC25209.1 glucuronate isomerase [Brenneria nigrifluens] [Brenneria nigrifluens DSM 30175 = ATCC 13028]QCR04965.1 glucuronate isomerase [Brenneria nigrifluens] [Brenneria nigrifluens DSM 30175 = ATCC 13028]